jgi:hypothetical protein
MSEYGQAVVNTFCPTGTGGGIDPTCGSKGGKTGSGAGAGSPRPMASSQVAAALSRMTKGQPVSLVRLTRDGTGTVSINGTVSSVRKVKTSSGPQVEAVSIKYAKGETSVNFGDRDVVSIN